MFRRRKTLNWNKLSLTTAIILKTKLLSRMSPGCMNWLSTRSVKMDDILKKLDIFDFWFMQNNTKDLT